MRRGATLVGRALSPPLRPRRLAVAGGRPVGCAAVALALVAASTLPCAAVGAAFESMEDAQQWNMVIISPLIAATVLMGPGVTSPDTPVTIAASMVPFCSPLVMYTRIVSGNPPPWQIGLSIALLAATIWLALRLCGRIYRVGILMYGKRVRIGEIAKWLRYS